MAISNTSSFISTASQAPINEPNIAGIESRLAFLVSSTFCCLKLVVATSVCIVIAILFVPFASGAGKPSIINTDKEIILPPPARVFIKPTSKPAEISAIISTKTTAFYFKYYLIFS